MLSMTTAAENQSLGNFRLVYHIEASHSIGNKLSIGFECTVVDCGIKPGGA